VLSGALRSGALLCLALQRASKQRYGARTGVRKTHKLTKAAFGFRRPNPKGRQRSLNDLSGLRARALQASSSQKLTT